MMRSLRYLIVASLLLLAPIAAALPATAQQRAPGPVTVSIGNPSDGAEVGGYIIITGNASGPAGVELSVEVSIDGSSPDPALGNTSWRFSWSTDGLSGPHSIRAVASAGGDQAEASITVVVNNVVGFKDHTPAEPNLTASPDSTLNFSVSLSGPLGTASIRWSKDALEIPSASGQTGFSLHLPANATGSLTVEARLIQGASVVDSIIWNIALRPQDRPPRLFSRAPADDNLSADQGDRADFSVLAGDPDGEALNITWTLDGTKMASGINRSSVRVTFDQGGDHRLTASITDGNLTIDTSWNVSVRAAYVVSLLDFVPCLVYIVMGLFLGIWYGKRTGRAPGQRPYGVGSRQ